MDSEKLLNRIFSEGGIWGFASQLNEMNLRFHEWSSAGEEM
jgi:hypothetical protein